MKNIFIFIICVITHWTFVFGQNSVKETSAIEWHSQPDFEWARGCKFGPHFVVRANAKRSLCGHLCVISSECSHFTWTPNRNGTCYMSSGPIGKENATKIGDESVICGVAERGMKWHYAPQFVWSQSCDFPSGNFTLSQGGPERCIEHCGSSEDCNYFVWKPSTFGSCYIGSGKINRKNATNVKDHKTSCGIISRGMGINWKRSDGIDWSDGCTFHLQHYTSAKIDKVKCRHFCKDSDDCSHFVWKPKNGGTCYLIGWQTSKEQAFLTDDPSISCGIISKEAKMEWKVDSNFEFVPSCKFQKSQNSKFLKKVDTDLSNCGQECENTLNCTHFEWSKENQCHLKVGQVTKMDASYNENPDTFCGLAKKEDSEIQWKDFKTASNCYFDVESDDLLPTLTANSSQCREECKNNNVCTHYTWREGAEGICHIRAGSIWKQDGKFDSDQNSECGIKTRNVTLQWKKDGGITHASGCDFGHKNYYGYYSTHSLLELITNLAECGKFCQVTSKCTHFEWTSDDGGVCKLKQGSATERNAIFNADTHSVCAAVNKETKLKWNKDVGSNMMISKGCEFLTTYFTYRISDDETCAHLCSITDGCTHFEWSPLKIGYCLLRSGPVNRDSVYWIEDTRQTCGIKIENFNSTEMESDDRQRKWHSYRMKPTFGFDIDEKPFLLNKDMATASANEMETQDQEFHYGVQQYHTKTEEEIFDSNFTESEMGHFNLRKVVCDGTNDYLTCPIRQKLVIVSATYGRTNSKTCSNIQTSSDICSVEAKNIFKMCHRKYFCTISTNGIHDDPCPGIKKYLEVIYRCM